MAALTQGARLGPYEILSAIGQGGMARCTARRHAARSDRGDQSLARPRRRRSWVAYQSNETGRIEGLRPANPGAGRQEANHERRRHVDAVGPRRAAALLRGVRQPSDGRADRVERYSGRGGQARGRVHAAARVQVRRVRERRTRVRPIARWPRSSSSIKSSKRPRPSPSSSTGSRNHEREHRRARRAAALGIIADVVVVYRYNQQ